ncbi:cAMP-binding domain of CRP or a regulatory subunit of cAMP-dependent protein kinases [Parasphingorhabdus marina DSM 22363]|uniref:cAMP-binding domain of CRP or a regulatory subunit of cAMP-dependent protein kinases n=1 Tax=Parasphingorhabdus marina DSM 22363 TaxID=1123272 RepID=A0A1N6EU64_9SPHN|nr:Crp/Fnr family transcriptional regulator [Parasphingorhabdus marina]SIN86547.1 cAMP-binding domain of CRP or a regulatory subunit of cAMP-dependent protein kinases [Parasphingorhabdus marina DSM 22363]
MEKYQLAASSTMGATGFVAGLPADVRDRLLGAGRRRSFAKGEIIQQRGDPGREFWHIESGSVQIGRYSVDGRLTLFALLGPGESFGEQAFLGEFPRMVDAMAGSEAVLIRIGEAELQALIESDPRAARILLKTMARMVQQAFDLVEASRNLSAIDRTRQALFRLCGGQDKDIAVPVTQQELADLVGVSRVSLGKALGELESQGAIRRKYGKIIVSGRSELLSPGP